MKMAERSPNEWKTVGKGETALYEQFLLFPQFSKDSYCIHVKTTLCLGKGSVHSSQAENGHFIFQHSIANWYLFMYNRIVSSINNDYDKISC